MKCPKCSHNQKFRDGMTCNHCGYGFLFSPKSGPRVSDNLFQVFINRASGHSTRYFTENQLHAIYHKAHQKKGKQSVLGVAISAAIFLPVIALAAPIGVVLFFSLIFLATGFKGIRQLTAPHTRTRDTFDTMLKKWRTVHHIGKLIERPNLGQPPSQEAFEDLYDYGVERIVVVDRDITVDLLVRNGWHAENKALVIAESGYPQYLEELAVKLMEEREDLPILLLHDATDRGVGLLDRVKQAGRLPLTRRKIRDLGLFPTDVEKMPMLKKMGTKKTNHKIPLDTMGYGTIATAMGAAILGNVAFASLVDPNSPYYGGGGSAEADFG